MSYDDDVFNENRYYTEVWLKYVREFQNIELFFQALKVKKPEDVFDTMLNNKVGTCFAKTYANIAEYYEHQLLDYRKADKIMRVAM